jgi:hypothetical protein
MRRTAVRMKNPKTNKKNGTQEMKKKLHELMNWVENERLKH